jgi:hypothetical protein
MKKGIAPVFLGFGGPIRFGPKSKRWTGLMGKGVPR